jgi:sugar lactone lactonase YvrE
MIRPTRSAPQAQRRRHRRAGALTTALALAAATTACTPPPPARCAPAHAPASVPADSPWAGVLCVQASQTPPGSLNGVVYRDGRLWMASLLGNEIVVADAATGQIVGRFGPDQGVTGSPDDLAMAPDGTVYWGAFQTGEVGVLRPGERSRVLVNVGQGVNPVVIGPDGALYVSKLFTAMGLHRVDPATGAATLISRDAAINGFGFGPDGAIYGPTGLTNPSRMVRIDPADGRVRTIAPDFGLLASSVRFPPAARGEAPTTAYVLTSTAPVAVRRIDITTGRRVAPDLPLPLTLADNVAFAPDGTMYVTGFTEPAVAVVGVDGRTAKVRIGRS